MEEKMTTREKIIYESLRLFSNKGYDGVSMREIAAAVGIKGASIYNHFKGKEDIFNAIFSEMIKKYDDAAAIMNIPAENNPQTISIYAEADIKQLLCMAEQLFAFFTQNEFAVMFRKLLVSEQHKSPAAAKCFKEYYLEAPVLFQSRIFDGLKKEGKIGDYNPDIMALHFYSPVYYILCRYDSGCPYDECLAMIKLHVKQFCKIYEKLN